MARRRRMFRRATRYVTRVVHARRREGGMMGRFGGWIKSIASRPSKPIAAALTIGGLVYLLLNPLSDGDSWLGRLKSGYAQAQASGNPFDMLAFDDAGNNALSIAGLQIVNNIWGAAGPLAGAVVVRWLGRRFGF